MGIPEVLIIIGMIFIAIVALKLIIRAARFLVSLGLFLVAAGIVLSVFTGQDLFGINPAVGYVVHTINQTVQNVPIP
ncbi:hypothetical protein HY489_06275 [Candidatus Woesearchaeota archaeon]|nr:hypothetical protein [Candidatus Woesearchaeota archaeon]